MLFEKRKTAPPTQQGRGGKSAPPKGRQGKSTSTQRRRKEDSSTKNLLGKNGPSRTISGGSNSVLGSAGLALGFFCCFSVVLRVLGVAGSHRPNVLAFGELWASLGLPPPPPLTFQEVNNL